MEKPRPVFFIVLGIAVAALVYLLVIRGNGDEEKPTPTPTTPSQAQAPSQTQTQKQSTSTPKPDTSSEPSPVRLPPTVASAMLKRRVVVVLFWSKRGSVDRQVKQSVDRIRKNEPKSKIAVFYSSPSRIADYSFIAGDVSQTPAIVVVDRSYKTKLLEGYIDYSSILQHIREAERVPPA